MAEARTALAVADDDQSSETEALTALYGFRDAVDVNQLLDQLFTLFLVPIAATVVATATAATLATVAIAATAATTTGTTALGLLLLAAVWAGVWLRLGAPTSPQ